MHRFAAEPAPFAPGPVPVEIALGTTDRADASFAYPLRLMAVEVGLTLPATTEATVASVELGRVQASAEPTGGSPDDWSVVPLERDQGWRLTTSISGAPHQRVGDRVTGGTLSLDVPADGLPTIAGVDRFGAGPP